MQEVREQIASFWEHWKDRKSDFGNVAEWWDSGNLWSSSRFTTMVSLVPIRPVTEGKHRWIDIVFLKDQRRGTSRK